MAKFEKLQPDAVTKLRPEPPQLERFIANAAVTAPPKLTDDKARRGGPGLEMNVRFTPEEKAALEKLAASEERSQQQVLMRVAGPLLLEAAQKLG